MNTTSHSGRLCTWALSVISPLSILFWLNACIMQPVIPTGGDGSITSIVYAHISDTITTRMPLPLLNVQLRNVPTNTIVAVRKTDKSGYYKFDGLAPGTYQICLQEPNWEAVCGPLLQVNDKTTYAKPLFIQPRVTRSNLGDVQQGIVWGKVRLADGTVPMFYNSLFQMETKIEVELLDAQGNRIGQPSIPDTDGNFIFSDVPTTAATIRAWSNKDTKDTLPLSVTLSITDASSLLTHATPLDLTFANRRPVISDIRVELDNQHRIGEMSEVTVTAIASDPQGDLLEYHWSANRPDSIIKGDGATVNLYLPSIPGLYTLYLLVYDGKGGYATRNLTLLNDGDRVSRSSDLYNSVAQSPVLESDGACDSQINPSGIHFNQDDFHQPDWFGRDGHITATTYYNVIDPDPPGTPAPRKNTIREWWQENGFDEHGVPISEGTALSAELAYLNKTPLGVGRFLRCRLSTSGDAACYVVNHGDANGDPLNADFAATTNFAANNDAQAKTIGSIVAMEYSSSGLPGGDKVVKFYIFDPPRSQGSRQEFIQLGGSIQAFLPNVCLYCHGAKDKSDLNLATADLGASFREIDPANFCFPSGQAKPTITETTAIYVLNQIVSATHPAPAIQTLIQGWYPSSNTTPVDYVAADWHDGGDKEKLYRNVIKPSCQICHIAFPSNTQAQNFVSYSTFTDRLPIIQYDVFDRSKMPFAFIPYVKFWQDCASQPMQLAQFTGTNIEIVKTHCPH